MLIPPATHKFTQTPTVILVAPTALYSHSANGGLRYTVQQFADSAALQSYYSLAIYLVIAFILCSLLAVLAYVFSLSTIQDTEKLSEYECGFEPFDSATRLPFDVHFYLVGILFLIFDVEIVLLFPWVLGVGLIGWFGFFAMIFFLVLLGVGFLYEWKRGALIWPSRQRESAYKPD